MLQLKTWAVVGATDNKEKFGYKIFKAMHERGMQVYPVNPGITEVLGQKCYQTLKDLPIKPDAVNFVVPPRVGEQIIRDCVELGIQNVWLQPGADAEQVILLAQQQELTVVSHACIMLELRKKGEYGDGKCT
jgi:hypothetical protein